MKDPTIFEKWFGKNKKKVIWLGNYKHYWDKPSFWFHTNGGKRKNGDSCFDLNINFGYLHFSYTNYGLSD